ILWRCVYYEAILECRKRLRLQVPLYEASQSMLSLAGSVRGSEGTASSDSSAGAVAGLEEWWAMTLTTLFNEALGYFQTLLRRVLAQLRDRSALDYSLAYVRGSAFRFPPAFLLARRLYLVVGDIYRYQGMYLPQLSEHSSTGAIDTGGLSAMAQATYSRARAMHTDSGSACVQLALLAASAQRRFDAVFWQMCGLCYADSAILRVRRMAAAPDADAGCDDYDHIEDLVIRLAQTLVQHQAAGIANADCDALSISGQVASNAHGSLTDSRDNTSSSNTIRASGSKDGVDGCVGSIYRELLDALNDDLHEAQNCDAPLHLDTDFWSREFQLSAILAALLTTVAYGSGDSDSGILLSTEPTQTAVRMYMIQHLAAVLLLRQMLCLQQTLELNGLENDCNDDDDDCVACTAYPLMSLALWVDIWRSGPHLLASLNSKPGMVDMGAGLSDSLKRLFSCLLLLIRGYSDLDIEDTHCPDMHSNLAAMVLPHDVSLMGWMSLRPVQRKLRYGALGELPGSVLSWNADHSGIVAGGLESKECSSVYHLEQHGQTASIILANNASRNKGLANNANSNKGLGACPNISSSSSMSSLDIVPEDELARADNNLSAVYSSGAVRPLYVPDADFWLQHLALVQKMLLSNQCIVVLPSVVNDRLLKLADTTQSSEERRARAALALISSHTDAETNHHLLAQTLLIQGLDETLAQWEDVCDYYAIGLDEIDEYELPSIAEVAEDMRGLIMSILFLAHFKCPGEYVALVTDCDELEFYASWFGIERESSAAFLDPAASALEMVQHG
ncbi:hypothetical protein EV175_005170, partial [Coemansia sp. RSA 1933]